MRQGPVRGQCEPDAGHCLPLSFLPDAPSRAFMTLLTAVPPIAFNARVGPHRPLRRSTTPRSPGDTRRVRQAFRALPSQGSRDRSAPRRRRLRGSAPPFSSHRRPLRRRRRHPAGSGDCGIRGRDRVGIFDHRDVRRHSGPTGPGAVALGAAQHDLAADHRPVAAGLCASREPMKSMRATSPPTIVKMTVRPLPSSMYGSTTPWKWLNSQ